MNALEVSILICVYTIGGIVTMTLVDRLPIDEQVRRVAFWPFFALRWAVRKFS